MGEIGNEANPPVYAPSIFTTKDNPQQRRGAIPELEMAIDDLNIAKKAMRTTSVNHIFSSVVIILTTIRVSSFLFCDGAYRVHM